VTRSDGVVVCEECLVAATPFTRLRGLLGRKSLPSGQAIAADLRPWRAAGKRGARAVLELPAGECARRGLAVGDQVRFA
jgi:uncharacterized protein